MNPIFTTNTLESRLDIDAMRAPFYLGAVSQFRVRDIRTCIHTYIHTYLHTYIQPHDVLKGARDGAFTVHTTLTEPPKLILSYMYNAKLNQTEIENAQVRSSLPYHRTGE